MNGFERLSSRETNNGFAVLVADLNVEPLHDTYETD